ncbi:PREDICTED: galanin receptor type 1-like [Cyprinodon variegatus]|uniref:galanin receptor type 1-like n=1 Tax=Cyprinodon variegatus TaxID=28743 RepID=UPI000742B098|nr:PREDICTED: galanin receptor type 1-like [Cyprinodon variegatus]
MEQQVENQSQLLSAGALPATVLMGVGVDNFISLLIFGIIFILGVLGNSLVITVLARSKPGQPRSTTNIFILNLSVADLSYLLFCVPFQSTIYMLPTWVLGAFICKFIHYFFTVSMLVSIFTLSAMSVDRYVAIVHARKASSIRVGRHALLGVVLIWTVSVVMAAPVAHYQSIVEREDNNTFCWEVWPEQHRKIYVMCTFVFGYLLPLCLISVCYAKVLNHLHKKLRNISKKSELSKKKVGGNTVDVDLGPRGYGSSSMNATNTAPLLSLHCLIRSEELSPQHGGPEFQGRVSVEMRGRKPTEREDLRLAEELGGRGQRVQLPFGG